MRRPTLLRTASAHLLLDTLFQHRDAGRYALHGFVILPEHLHVILTPADDQTIEQCAQSIKGGLSHRLHSPVPVWQPGFDQHCIRDAEDFQRQLDYLADNPRRRHLKNHLYLHTNFMFKIDPIPSSLGAQATMAGAAAPLDSKWVCQPAIKGPARRRRSSPELLKVIRRLTHLTLKQAVLRKAAPLDLEESTPSVPPY